jgi:hypothetical protein
MSSEPRSNPPRYWAFISYSRADSAWAKRVQRRLEKLVIPQSARAQAAEQGPNARSLKPVFLDEDELAASSDLGAGIREAIEQAAYLVVICSPRSARSKWVDAEIRHAMEQGRVDRILLLLVEGEPRAAGPGDETESLAAFAPALAELPTEPLWVDARPQSEGNRRALTRIAAGMLGLGFDDLWRREQRRRRARLSWMTGLAALVAVTVGGLFALQSAPVDVAECRLGAVVFRDPWVGSEFAVERVGVDYYYVGCSEDVPRPEEIATNLDCVGPYGSTILKGVFVYGDETLSRPPETVYAVWNAHRGAAPCCWWDALDEVGFMEMEKQRFRWLATADEPLMQDFGFSSIEVEEPYSTVSEGLAVANPLMAAVCEQTRLATTLSRISKRFSGE